MKKTYSFGFMVAVAAFFTASAVCISAMVFQFGLLGRTADQSALYSSKLTEIKGYIDEYFTGDVDNKMLEDGLSAGLILGLDDKYAAYITAENAQKSMNSMHGLNVGLGIQVISHPDTGNIYVTDVHAYSPAETAGILPGDEITEVDGNVITEYGYTNTLAYIRSLPLGTTVHASLKRGEEILSLDILLTQYESQSVFYKNLDGRGYIHITEFNDRTVEQFNKAVDALQGENVSCLIFDLRGNGGGTLLSVCSILDRLLPEGIIVEVKYKDENRNEAHMSDKNEVNLPMAVLTDANTASASELFSQSLKDYGKAFTVGSVTYGKGVVQNTFTLKDGSLIRITVAKYYTKSGICVDGIGVSPDVPTEWTSDEKSHRMINSIEADKDFIAACEHLGV